VAAQTEKIPRVGFLCWVTCGDEYHEAFWQSLRKLGYHDYRNITFDNRAAGGDGASLDTLALQLVGLKPTVIVADTTQSARALKSLSKTLPVVVSADDPVGSGFTSNLARPDGNITGLSSVAAELGVIQLQLLKEVVPTASRVAVIGNPINPATKLRMEAMQTAARASGISLLSIEVRNPTEHESAFAAIKQMHANAVIDITGRGRPQQFGDNRPRFAIGNEASVAGNLSIGRSCRRRRSDVLRAKRGRRVQAGCKLCGQDPQGRKTC